MTEMIRQKNTAVIIVNLGTPDNPSPAAIRRFLRQFLWDPRVVEVPRLLWWLILNLIIAPFRPYKTASSYQRLWDKFGDSPLRIFSNKQQESLQKLLDSDADMQGTAVYLAMSYGAPGIGDVMKRVELEGYNAVVVLPLYPQYSATTTGAIHDQFVRVQLGQRNITNVHFVKNYYDEPLYRKALCNSVQQYRQANGSSELLLMSFHGIPKANIEKGDPYYQQCLDTAATLAADLGLDESQWRISFQSRLGKATWLEPYTTALLEEVAAHGVKTIDVVCPSFSVDCLETLEEIAVEGKADFRSAGGEDLRLIPCMNDDEEHIQMMKGILMRQMPDKN